MVMIVRGIHTAIQPTDTETMLAANEADALASQK